MIDLTDEPDRVSPAYLSAVDTFGRAGLPPRACHALAACGVADLADLRGRQLEGEGGLFRELMRHMWIGGADSGGHPAVGAVQPMIPVAGAI